MRARAPGWWAASNRAQFVVGRIQQCKQADTNDERCRRGTRPETPDFRSAQSQRRGLTIHSPPSTGTGTPRAVGSIESARRSTSAHLTVRRTPMTTPRDQLFTRRMCNPEVASYARGAVPASWCDSRSKDYWSVGRAERVRPIAAMSRPRKSALTCRPSVGVLLPAGSLSNAQLCHRNRGQIHDFERSRLDTLPQWLVPNERVSR